MPLTLLMGYSCNWTPDNFFPEATAYDKSQKGSEWSRPLPSLNENSAQIRTCKAFPLRVTYRKWGSLKINEIAFIKMTLPQWAICLTRV